MRVIISKNTSTAYTSFKYSESLVPQVLVVCHMQVKRQPFSLTSCAPPLLTDGNKQR